MTNKVHIGAKIPVTLRDRMDRLARKEGRGRSNFLVLLITEKVKELEEERKHIDPKVKKGGM